MVEITRKGFVGESFFSQNDLRLLRACFGSVVRWKSRWSQYVHGLCSRVNLSTCRQRARVNAPTAALTAHRRDCGVNPEYLQT